MDAEVTSNILPYFRAVRSAFLVYNPRNYKIGVYGARNICSRVSDEGIATTSFVGDLASGFSGNLGYPLPRNWAFDQIKEYTIGSGDGEIYIDKNIASGRDNGVSYLTAASSDEAPYDKKGLLEYLNNRGILTNIKIAEFGVRYGIGIPTITSYITIEGEISFEEELVGPINTITFDDPTSFTATLMDDITNAGIEIESEIKLEKGIIATIESFKLISSVNNVKYSVEVGLDGELIVTLEHSESCPPRFGGDEATAFQRCYITIHPKKYTLPGLLTIPVVVSDSSEVSSEANDSGFVMNGPMTVAAIAIFAGVIFVSKNPQIGAYAATWFMTKISTLGALFAAASPFSIEETSNKDN